MAYVIKDWAGNYPFNKYIKAPINGADHKWQNWDDAEQWLATYLGDEYDELRGEYYILEEDNGEF